METTFGTQLRQLRQDAGLSLRQLAHQLHYDPGHLSKIENGLKRASVELARACDQVFATDGGLAELLATFEVTRRTHPDPRRGVGAAAARSLPGTFDRVTMSGERQARVAVVPTWLGDDGELLRAIDDQFDGLVIAAFGAGHVPVTLVPVLTELAHRMPVVLATRTGAGPVLRRTYGFAGSERDLQDRGLINAGALNPYKARILLHLLLTRGAEPGAIAATFDAAATS